jgi:hypothetical protein
MLVILLNFKSEVEFLTDCSVYCPLIYISSNVKLGKKILAPATITCPNMDVSRYI